MKTKTWLVALPILCMAGVAMAQSAAQDEAQVQSEAQAREEAQVREEVQVQEQKPTASTRKRQGADMRHCLDKKDPKEISRCAEPGRKP
jgi:hypothetical protein